MRGIADAATGRIKDLGERDFAPAAGEVLFFAPEVTPASDRLKWMRGHRVDGDGTVRLATGAEQADFDAEHNWKRLDPSVGLTTDAVLQWALDAVNEVRASLPSPLPAIEVANARQQARLIALKKGR